MAKLIVQAGGIAVIIKDDRALHGKKQLKRWEAAASELIAGVVDLIGAVEEEVEDE